MRDKYEKQVAPQLKEELDIKNKMAIPKIEKVVVNVGAGEMTKDKQLKEALANDLAIITGQTPAVRQANISIASFGIRSGMPVGLKVTLRGEKMYDFLDRLISMTLPRLRDFRGIARKSFDEKGNYTLGMSDHTVFPEIDLAKVAKPHGLEVTIVTNANDRSGAIRLLELMGMPFEKEE